MNTLDHTSGSLELALEPRMMFDAAAVATAAEVAADAQAQADAPVSAEASKGDITVDAEGKPSGDADLYGKVSVEALEGGKSFDSLTLHTSTSGKGLALMIDGKEVTLTNGNKVPLGDADDDRAASVTIDAAGKATVVITLTGWDSTKVEQLIDGLALKVTDGKLQPSGSVEVTLESLSYLDGGDAAQIDVTRTVEITSKYNFAPEVNVGGTDLSALTTIPGVEDATKIYLSSNGNYAFVGDKDGDVAVFKVTDGKLTHLATFDHSEAEGLNTVVDLASSADGKILYVLSKETVFRFDVSDDGKLTKVADESFWGNTATTVSTNAKGDVCFVGYATSWGYSNRILTLNEYGFFESKEIGDNSSMDFASSGDYVVKFLNSVGVVQKPLLAVYDKSGNELFHTDLAGIDFGKGNPKIVASSNGIVALEFNGKLQVWQVDFTAQTFAKISDLSVSNVIDLSLSASGDRLYVLSSNDSGTLMEFGVAKDGVTQIKVSSGVGGDAAGLVAFKTGSIGIIAAGQILQYSEVEVHEATFGQNLGIGGSISISDSDRDAANNGAGDYKDVTLTLQAKDSDKINSSAKFQWTAAGDYTLSEGNIQKGGKDVASLKLSDGEVVLTFKEGATSADVAAIVQHIGLKVESSTQADGRVSVVVSVKDGTQVTEKTIQYAFAANHAPTASGSSAVGNGYYHTPNVSSPVFKDVSIGAGEFSQLLSKLEFSVQGVSGEGEYLVVDGTKIALNAASSGKTASGYTYEYSFADGKGVLKITSESGMKPGDASSLVGKMTYVNENDKSTTGDRVIALVRVGDNGGDYAGGVDEVEVKNVSATIRVHMSVDPDVSVETPGFSDLIFTDGGEIVGADYYVCDLEQTADGKTVFVLGSSKESGAGKSTLYIYSRNADGSLALKSSFELGSSPGSYPGSIAVAPDGKTIYVRAQKGENSFDLVIHGFRADDAGKWSVIDGIDLSGESTAWVDVEVDSSGRYLAAMSDDTLYLYTIGEDGGLSLVSKIDRQSLQLDGDDAELEALKFSGDGKYLYVTKNGMGGNEGISIVSIGSDGQLSLLTKVTYDSVKADENGVKVDDEQLFIGISDLITSADGKFVYASSDFNSSWLMTFARNVDGTLTLVQAVQTKTWDGGFTIGKMQLSADGSLLFGTADDGKLMEYAVDSLTGKLSQTGSVESSRDGGLGQFILSADGKNIYFASGSKGFASAEAIPQFSYSGNVAEIGKGLSGLDADVEDYKGFTVSIERSPAANAADAFSFGSALGYTFAEGKILGADGAQFGTYAVDKGVFTISFTGSVNQTAFNNILHAVRYEVAKDVAGETKFKVTMTDEVGKSDSEFFSIKAADEGIDVPEEQNIHVADPSKPTDLFGSVDFSGIEESILPKTDVITVNAGYAAGEFGLLDKSGFSLADDGSVMKGNVKMGAWSVKDGVLEIALEDGLKAADVKALLQAVTFTAKDAAPGTALNVDLHIQFTSSNGGSETLEVAGIITLDINDGPEFNASKYPDYALDGTVDKALGGAAGGIALPDDLFTDDVKVESVKVELVDADGNVVKNGLADLGIKYENGKLLGTVTKVGTYQLRLTASDASGLTATKDVTLEVRENQAPVVVEENVKVPTIVVNNKADFSVKDWFKDSNADELTYALVKGLPEGLTFDPKTDTISGTPRITGTFDVTISATDGQTDPVEYTFKLAVRTNAAPQGEVTSSSFGFIDGVSTSVDLHDFIKDLDGDEVKFTVEGLPEGLTFDAETGRIVGTPKAGDPFTLTITAKDAYGLSSTFEVTVSVRANDGPVFAGNGETSDYNVTPAVIGDVGGGLKVDFNKLFKDPNGDKLTFTILEPAELSGSDYFNPETGVLQFNSMTEQRWFVTVKATDPAGLAVTQQIVVGFLNARVNLADPGVVNAPFGEHLDLLRDENLVKDLDDYAVKPTELAVDRPVDAPVFGAPRETFYAVGGEPGAMSVPEKLFALYAESVEQAEGGAQTVDRGLERRIERAVERLEDAQVTSENSVEKVSVKESAEASEPVDLNAVAEQGLAALFDLDLQKAANAVSEAKDAAPKDGLTARIDAHAVRRGTIFPDAAS